MFNSNRNSLVVFFLCLRISIPRVRVPLFRGVPGVSRNLGQTQLSQPRASARLQEASCESRPAGTTRGEGIKENVSDKHNLQPLTTFIQVRLIKMPHYEQVRPARF